VLNKDTDSGQTTKTLVHSHKMRTDTYTTNTK